MRDGHDPHSFDRDPGSCWRVTDLAGDTARRLADSTPCLSGYVTRERARQAAAMGQDAAELELSQ
jgi:hypothetical protein